MTSPLDKARDLFKDRINLIITYCQFAEDAGNTKEYLIWSHILWQEVVMWCQIGEPVTKEDFEFICLRRGIKDEAKSLLKDLVEATELHTWEAHEQI